MKHNALLVLVAVALGCGAEPVPPAPQASTEAPAAVTTTLVFNEAGAPIVELDTPGMHCGACAANICKALREQPGVVDVKADADTKVVAIAIDESTFETDAAIAAIADAGFGEATLVEAAATNEPSTTGEPG